MGVLFNKIWGILGIILSASSIFSLMQRGFDISLAFSISEMLNYYRDLVSPIFEFLYKPVYWIFPSFKIPNWVTDAQILSIFATSIYVKARSTLRVNGEQVHFKTLGSKIHTIFILGITMFGLIMLPIIIFSMLTLPIGFITNLRIHLRTSKWYKERRTLKWLDMYNILGSAVTSQGELAWVAIMGIFGYMTLFTVAIFYMFNSILG